MASTLKRRVLGTARRSRSSDSSLVAPAAGEGGADLPPLKIHWKTREELDGSEFGAVLAEVRRRRRKHDESMAEASILRAKQAQFHALSAHLVADAERYHPQRLLRRLEWKTDLQAIKRADEESRSLVDTYTTLDHKTDHRRQQISAESETIPIREATQPFVTQIQDRQRLAALANAMHYVCEDQFTTQFGQTE
eukprot:g2761.t1